MKYTLLVAAAALLGAGSPTYDPNAALPSLGNQGSTVTPNPGTSASGINTPSTSTGGSTSSGASSSTGGGTSSGG
jgi:hypothetical protein